MRRRSIALLMGATVTGTAGCLSFDQEYTVNSLGPRDEEPALDLEVDVTVLNGEFSDPDQPLTVELSVTNLGDEEIAFWRHSTVQRTDYDIDSRFVLASVERVEDEGQDYHEFRGDCWAMTRDVPILFGKTVTLESGETIREPHYLLIDDTDDNGDDGENGCPDEPPESIPIWLSFSPQGGSRQAEWGFELERVSGPFS